MTFNHAIAKVTSVAVLSLGAVCLPSSASVVPIALDEFSLNGSFANTDIGGLNVSGLTGVSASYTIAGALAPEGVAWVTRSIDDPLRIRLSKHVAAEPAELFVRARIPPDPRNRALRIEWWTPAGVGGSHSITLDGDQSARQQECAVRRMGAGEYIVTAVLLSSDGSEVRRKTRVIVTGESRLW